MTADTFVGNGITPVGGIILWSGATNAVPGGWALCNGSNGTPDLRDRFVVGAGDNYAVNATGGSADAVVVQHNHAVGTLAGTTNDPGNHTHTFADKFFQRNPDSNAMEIDVHHDDDHGSYGSDSKTTGGNGAHTHTVTITGSTANQGVSGTNANLPPYYALAYIMRTT